MTDKKTEHRKQFSTILADYLLLLRQNRKLSLADIASQTKMSSQAISLYERGKRFPSVEAMSRLASFYNVDEQAALKIRENAIIDTTRILGDDTPIAIKNEYVALTFKDPQITIDGEPLTADELVKATEYIKALRIKQNNTSKK